MPLADSHMHLFAGGYPGRYGPLFPRGADLAVYDAMRKVHHIDRALVIGYEGERWAHGNNRHIARLAQSQPWMAPLAFCTTTTQPREKTFQDWWNQGFKGISLYLAENADAVLAWGNAIFEVLNAKRALLSINVPIAKLDRLRPVFQKLPETRILISHLGLPGHLPGATTARSARSLLAPLLKQADLPHLGVKLSALYAANAYPHTGIAPVLKILRDAFGDRRLYWGSDFSPALDDVSFAQTVDGVRRHLQTDASSKYLFHDNLTRILKRVR